ncbi:hypothetical protein RRG08_057206 [Elysia crispata]|uniref:Uncharacterized protein n=1 Tax=Elysia crispata TaxID=231223 RepID=A0AAE1CNP0_9GAST|nr:hypothetical protein RRG08_057206 [Elysia crispata]
MTRVGGGRACMWGCGSRTPHAGRPRLAGHLTAARFAELASETRGGEGGAGDAGRRLWTTGSDGWVQGRGDRQGS